MKLMTIKNRELLDLSIVLAIAIILSIFSLSIHTIDRLYSFFNVYTDLPLAEFLINVSFLSLTGLLWTTYIRWRRAAKRQAELENIISSISPDVLLVVDPDRTIVECSDSLKRMFGYEVNEVINHETDFLYFDWRSDQYNQNDWHGIYDMFEKGGFHIGSATGKRKNGEIIPLEIISGNLSGRNGAVLLLRDITDRKRAEEKLKEYTRQIEEKNLELKIKNLELTATRAQLVQKEKLRALGQMASGVAHNFNNLLAIILGRAQLLQLKAKDTDIGKGLSIIERAALDASFTIKRIQDFTCVRKDQEFKWVNIDEVTEDVLALTKTKWKDQAEANGITIDLEIKKDTDELPPVAGDESELREVFTNIIFNAVEAMPKGGKITVKTQTDKKSVSVSFTDSGTGIPDEVKQKIFDPFFTTKGVRNTGLGLSVAYGIIQRHQGNIQIESQPGEGTTVVVRLPVSKIPKKEEPEEKKPKKPPGRGEPANILVIEDQKDVRELLFDILTSANYTVKLASGGAEGLEMSQREKFDIVFTDLGMPKMSGWEVARAIKEIDSYTTVFLITGWGVEMDEGKLKKGGIDRVVTKPVRVEVLLTLVSETMESKRRGKELVEGSPVHPVER